MIRPLRQFFNALRHKFSPAETRHPWLPNYPENIPWDVKIPSRPLFALLEDASTQHGANTAIDFLGKTISYRDLNAAATRLAAGLQAHGIKKGDRVGLFLPNSPHFVISYYAILKAGGVVVNFNPLYPPEDIAKQVKDSGVSLMITFALKNLLGKLETVRGQVDSMPHLLVAQFTEALPFPKNIIFPIIRWGNVMAMPSGDGYSHFADMLATSAAQLQPVAIAPEEDVAVLQYTGGTTGTPKGAMLTHANLNANAIQCGYWFTGMEEGKERMLGVLPLFHVFAMTAIMNLSVLKGLTMILHPQFDLLAVLKDIHRKKPTLLMGVPTMFNAILNHPKLGNYHLKSLKFCISGGAGLPREVKEKFESLTGCKLVEGYGLSETAPVAAANPLFGVNKTGSIGLPMPATIIEVVGFEGKEAGKVLPLGKTGEICLRGPQVMKGYWNKPDETRQCMRDGRFHTGDIGYIDADGYSFIVDRLKEMIISGGYNIYPRNVEEVLYRHPEVLEAAVVGVADPHWGQRVKAYVARKSGSGLSGDELLAFAQGHLPRFAWPAEIEFRDHLPKTMIGKISKKDL